MKIQNNELDSVLKLMDCIPDNSSVATPTAGNAQLGFGDGRMTICVAGVGAAHSSVKVSELPKSPVAPIAVSRKHLSAMIRAAKDCGEPQSTWAIKDAQVTVTFGSRRFNFSAVEPTGYPEPPKLEGKTYKLDAEWIRDFGLMRNYISPSVEDVNAIVCNRKTMVASDYFQLALVEYRSINLPSLVIPGPLVNVLIGYGESDNPPALYVQKDTMVLDVPKLGTLVYPKATSYPIARLKKVITECKAVKPSIYVKSSELLGALRTLNTFVFDSIASEIAVDVGGNSISFEMALQSGNVSSKCRAKCNAKPKGKWFLRSLLKWLEYVAPYDVDVMIGVNNKVWKFQAELNDRTFWMVIPA